MLVELHVIQSFAPSNLNRDDTGSPKDCEFGGVRRARISSQSLKRSQRLLARKLQRLPSSDHASRSRRFVDRLASRLAEHHDADEALAVARTAFAALGLYSYKPALGTRNDYPLFLTIGEEERLAEVCSTHWGVLVQKAPAVEVIFKRGGDGDKKKKARSEIGSTPYKDLDGALNWARAKGEEGGGTRAADLALFGRMLADLPEKNFDAAVQMAHAISTHAVAMQDDYFTAVDDWNPEDVIGAAHLDSTRFNSACYYRYASVDAEQLSKNLRDAQTIGPKSLAGFLQAALLSVPEAKQRAFAAHNPPALAMTVIRAAGQWSLANAFETPIRADSAGGLIERSIAALDSHYAELQRRLGEWAEVKGEFVCTFHPGAMQQFAGVQLETLPELVRRTVAFAFPNDGLLIREESPSS